MSYLKLVQDIEVPTTLQLLVGQEEMTFDEALTALKTLSMLMKQAEEKAKMLRQQIVKAMEECGLENYISPTGIEATLYQHKSVNWDSTKLKDFLKDIENEFRIVSVTKTVRIS